MARTAYPRHGVAAGEAVRVRGLVQGVGFRPAAFRLAQDCGVAGDVRNDGEGVLLRIWGARAQRERFLRRLVSEAPPLARLDAVEREPLRKRRPPRRFRILDSRTSAPRTAIVPDAAPCPACLAELRGAGRRGGYAFTNCTHCGPRLSILRRIPYDRAHTSMAGFAMCAHCAREYADPGDRRFHAQPIACPLCGPRLWFEHAGVRRAVDGDALELTRRALANGAIVAIKGVGGFQLACDATQADAVARLRARKHRDAKPFALMARDLAMIARHCRMDAVDAALLASPAAPIVLLEAAGAALAESIAPGRHCLGFMLPSSPLHALLMERLEAPIVLTSGNRSDAPPCIDNDEARQALGGIADAFLLHDREIASRVDDSVVRVIDGAPAILRRARGYAPAPLALPRSFAAAGEVLAFGGELKSTFCLLRGASATLSQHLGDLEDAATHAGYRRTLELYEALFAHRPRCFAIDAHPEYLSSKLGRERAAGSDTPLISVQHHHAHIAACLADNGIAREAPPVLGIALDGLGYGADGTLWGGEFLLAGYRGFKRLASLRPVPMPGGVQAVREPWRMAYVQLRAAVGSDVIGALADAAPLRGFLARRPLATLERMLEARFNCPTTSSCGRLFDAAASVLGLRHVAGYEGQAAMDLEAAVDKAVLDQGRGYPFAIEMVGDLPRLDPRPMWRELLEDQRRGCTTGAMAARFHRGLTQGIADMVALLARRLGDAWCGRVALSGGVFQNAIVGTLLPARLSALGLTVLRHRQVPANDGGLALGQAAVAAARMLGGS